MKNFITSMLGALVALVIFTFCGLLLFIGIMGAMVVAGVRNAAPSAKLENGSYIVFDLSTNITDAPPSFDFGDLSNSRDDTLQLRSVVRVLDAAARDNRIAGILIKGSLQPTDFGSGFGALAEVRAALRRFRNAGKPVKAYLEEATTRDYYLASVANQITIDPYGMIYMPGLASEPTFYAGAFEKFGIEAQVTRVGKYKSYVEPFIRKDMSPENREETQRLLDDVWSTLLTDIGRARRLGPARIQEVVDKEGFILADVAVAAHMADRSAYQDQLLDELKEETGRKGSDKGFKQISFSDYAKLEPERERSSSNAIGIVYAEGDIVDGEGATGEVGGESFARELRKMREDDDIKAVVLRVNSPGGSATAAEVIQREVRLTRMVKPVIVSMGSYAASGGYWISAYGNRIFAEPATITGSIGVFGIQFNAQKLFNDTLGITFDGVKTAKYADIPTITRPLSDDELAVFQRMVDWIYGQFIGKVAEGRKMKPADVEAIAQGRVWSGEEAMKLGLVDEIGGLGDAIRFAAKQANLQGYRIEEYPEKKELAEVLAELLGMNRPDETRIHSAGLVGELTKRLNTEILRLKAFNDPKGIYARLPEDISIR
jgi:protease-4